MNAVLVTGATGTVGRHVVTALVAAGESVRAAVPAPDRVDLPGAKPVRFDFAEPATWAAAFEDVDRIFLMRPPAISDVTTFLRPVIRLAADRGVRQVVFLSLMGVNRVMPHWQVERDIEAAGLPHTFLRPAFFAQNLLTAYRDDIRTRDRIHVASGRGRTSFVDTRDVAAVAALALREPAAHAGAAYTLTGPAALDYAEVAGLLSRALGRRIRYESVGLLRYRRELLDAGLDPTYVRVQLVINAAARLGLAATVTDAVPRLLGRPATPMAAFVADHAASWR
jgi:uncharacterized protein YbjT (DUF2867 family)